MIKKLIGRLFTAQLDKYKQSSDLDIKHSI